jgi:hypothetical protein
LEKSGVASYQENILSKKGKLPVWKPRSNINAAFQRLCYFTNLLFLITLMFEDWEKTRRSFM